MIALPLVLGVGVDNGVHLLHDYLASKTEGRGRLSHAIGRGVLSKALTTMIGFGALMISRQTRPVGTGILSDAGRRVLHGFRTGVPAGCSALARVTSLRSPR